VEVDDITRSEGCQLLFRVRKILRNQLGFPKGTTKLKKGKKWGVKAVFSTEQIFHEVLHA
jgi:tRNA A37 threonylcarbamoyladenosine dehydratase